VLIQIAAFHPLFAAVVRATDSLVGALLFMIFHIEPGYYFEAPFVRALNTKVADQPPYEVADRYSVRLFPAFWTGRIPVFPYTAFAEYLMATVGFYRVLHSVQTNWAGKMLLANCKYRNSFLMFKCPKAILPWHIFIPACKIAEKVVCRSVFLTIWHCILSAQLTKNTFFLAILSNWDGLYAV